MAIVKLNANDYIVWINTVDDPVLGEVPQKANYRPVMCTIDSSFSGSREAIDVQDKCGSGQGWSSSLPGVGSFEMTGTGNAIDESLEPSAASFEELFNLWKSGTQFYAKIGNKVDNQGTFYIREAAVWISSWTENHGLNEPFTFDFTLSGVGEPTGHITT